MAVTYSVSLSQIIKEVGLETVFMPSNPEELLVTCSDVNRPGLALGGYYDYFDSDRIQVLGKSEHGFLEALAPSLRTVRLEQLVSRRPPAVVVSRRLPILPDLREACVKYGVPLLHTADTTSGFMAALIAFLNVQLAPASPATVFLSRCTGRESCWRGTAAWSKARRPSSWSREGIASLPTTRWKSAGSRQKTLVGSAPDNIRHFIELRGIGIVNARRIFGMGAVKVTEKIDMVIQLEQWDSEGVRPDGAGQ